VPPIDWAWISRSQLLSPHRVNPGNTEITVPLPRGPGSGSEALVPIVSKRAPEQAPKALSIDFLSSRGATAQGLRVAAS